MSSNRRNKPKSRLAANNRGVRQSSASQRSGHGRRDLKVVHRPSFVPPEDWHEPIIDGTEYRIIVQPPGEGYRHAVTPDEIRDRLAELPDYMLASLDVVQLSSMTRKKQTYPCYGMQWGTALYLYPIQESLIESYSRPPRPSQLVETRMYGGRWEHTPPDYWQLTWTEQAIRDYYLNNVLLHELGHLLDDRNTSYVDRERYAEWFALEHGYKPSRNSKTAVQAKRWIRRRHHSK